MPSFTLDNKEFGMTSIKGEVIEVQQSTRTDVQSYGGGYSVLTEQYKPVHVESTNTQIDTVFIRDLQGREHTLQIKNSAVPVRQGSKVSIACVTQGKGESAKMLICGIVNHDLRSSARFHKGYSMAEAMGIEAKRRPAIIACLVLTGIGWLLSGGWGGTFAGFFVGVCLAFPLAGVNLSQDGEIISQKIDEYLKQVINEGYESSISEAENNAAEPVPA